MRRLINTTALIVFVLLVVDALRLPENLMNFLLFGIVPGTDTQLPATAMMILISIITGMLILEIAVRNFNPSQQTTVTE